MLNNLDSRRETNLADEVQNPCARIKAIHSKSKTQKVNNNNKNNPNEPKLTNEPFEIDCVC